MYTFECDDVCPHCGAELVRPEAIKSKSLFLSQVNGHGMIAEDDETDLCFNDPDAMFFCAACGNPLFVTPVEEI